MELEYLLRGGPARGVTSLGGIHQRVLCCIIHPSNSLQGYGVAGGGGGGVQRKVFCHAPTNSRQGYGGGARGNAAITPTHLACPRRDHNSVHLPGARKINAQKQALKKRRISSLSRAARILPRDFLLPPTRSGGGQGG